MSALLLWAVFSAAAQQPSGDAGITLSFSRVAVKAGEAAALPVYLVSDENYRKPLQVTLEFPTAQLTFQRVERDYLAEKANWKIAATVADHPEKKDVRIVKIDIDPGAAKFFPSGSVARAHFLVSKDSPDGDIVINAALAAPAPATPVAASDPGKITVFSKPVFACFFYMH